MRRTRSPYRYWFLTPAATLYVTLFLVPTAASFWFSLTRWDLFTADFIGLENFQQFFSEPFLVQGVVNTVHLRLPNVGAEDRAGASAGRAARPPASTRRAFCAPWCSFPFWSPPSASA